MHYKDLQNKLHFLDDDAFVHLLPAGSVAITDEEAAALAPTPDPQVVLAFKKDKLRAVREGLLNRLAGIALAAQLTGDAATTAAYLTVRQGLLDITGGLPTDDTVDSIVMTRYAVLKAACTPQMIAAFAQVDA